jgi:integrase
LRVHHAPALGAAHYGAREFPNSLKWSDIDLDAGTLRVNRQLQRVRRDGEKSGTLVFSEPKNASHRTVGLPQRAVGALRSHREHQLVGKVS